MAFDAPGQGISDASSIGGGLLSGLGDMLGGPWGMLGMSFGLPLLARLLGGGNREQNAFNEWKRQRDAVMNPNFLAQHTANYLPMLQQLSQGQRGMIATNANMFQNNLARNMAMTGANRSGIGALAATGASSMAGNAMAELSSENRRGAMNMALNDRNTMLQLLSQGPQSIENPWLQTIASGSNNFMSYLMDYNRMKQMRGMFNG